MKLIRIPLGIAGKAPSEWLTDMTEFPIPAGKVHASAMIDCFDGLIVSWPLGTSPDTAPVSAMLDTATKTAANGPDQPIVHFDRGAGPYGCLGSVARG